MKNIFKTLTSMPIMVFLLFVFAVSLGIATFIENDYGTPSAYSLVYGSPWLEAIMIFLGFGVIVNIFRFKLYKKNKITVFIFHIAFILILIGAGITRYFGFEGIMHIREGMSENRVLSSSSYLQVEVLYKGQVESYEKKLLLSKMGHNDFEFYVPLGEEKLLLKYKNFTKVDQSQMSLLNLDVEYQDEVKNVLLPKRLSISGDVVKSVSFGDIKILISWGAKIVPLDFALKLEDFILSTYPGSYSPSSYQSDVIVLDQNTSMPYSIYMNHVLDFKGYRFFQSSYDADEKGTVLSVNKDPGKTPTYLGYFLLFLGLFLNLFNPKSRLQKLFRSKSAFLVLSSFLIFGSLDLKADDIPRIDMHHAKAFGSLLVADGAGRVKPMDTFSRQILTKVSRTDNIFDMNSNQAILSMLIYPKIWQQVEMIKISNDKLKNILGVKGKKISFADAFDANQTQPYKLYTYIKKANNKSPFLRDEFDKDVIKVDERINILYSLYSGDLLKIFPKDEIFYSASEALNVFDNTKEISLMLNAYIYSIDLGIKDGKWDHANKVLSKIKEYQKQNATLPSQDKIDAEILFNKLQIFERLMSIYMILGIILFIIIVISMIRGKTYTKIFRFFMGIYILAFIAGVFGLALRWYISSHAPWSNGYESMIYLSTAVILAGLIVSRKSILTLACTSILAGTILFVAHLNWMDPQITNLVPVLKSYWLSIHVSVITASYGFFGISFLLGFVTLVFMVFKNTTQAINEASRINEISMMLGLYLLVIGNFLGAIWANESWGRYWGWDAKETWALISILIYAGVLHFRFVPRLSSKYVFALSSVLAFFSILMTYFGVNYYLSGMHSYGAGDPIPVPVSLYYTLGVIFVVSVVAKVRLTQR